MTAGNLRGLGGQCETTFGNFFAKMPLRETWEPLRALFHLWWTSYQTLKSIQKKIKQ